MSPQLYNLVYNSIWFTLPEMWESIDRLLSEREIREDRMSESLFGHVRDEMSLGPDRIARIDINGPMAPRIGRLEKMCGATDYGDIRSEIESAMQSGAKGILLSVDSPGGTAVGTLPTMKSVLAAAQEVPVFAHVHTQATSAAYMLISQATKIYAEHSSILGSIGGVACLSEPGENEKKYGKRVIKVTSSGADRKVMAKEGTYSAEEIERVRARLDELLDPILTMIDDSRDVDHVGLEGDVMTSDFAMSGDVGLLDHLSSGEEETREALRRAIYG